jgi:Carboxypeptidase regulatory-like domain
MLQAKLLHYSPMPTLRLILMYWLAISFQTPSFAQTIAEFATLHGTVMDENGLPVSAVEVTLQCLDARILAVYTDSAGRFSFPALPPGDYRASLSKSGFFRLANQPVIIGSLKAEVSFVLNHETE